MAVVNSVSIDWAHEEIHEGKHFFFSRTKTMDNVTANTVTITTPASSVGFIHLVYDAEITAAGTFAFSQSPQATDGSALTVYNNNLNSSNTSGVVVAGGVVWTSAGTVFETHYVGANNPNVRSGGGAEARNEWILKPSTKYGFRATNTAATCYSVINLYFYLE